MPLIVPEIPGYRLLSRLGRGAFGVVYEAVWEEGFSCAVKLLEEGALHREYLASVLERLSELPAQDGILPFYAYDLTDGMPHVSMALMDGGAVTFDDLTGKLTREESWELLRQLAETLAWLHENSLVHAGLTGGNVFVVAAGDGSARAVLTDVGQAWLGDGTMQRLHDQAPYVPPERWLAPDRVLQDGHAETWDVYAFGVLAWRLLNGRWPRASRLFDQVLAAKGERLEVDPPAFAEWLMEEPAPEWPRRARDPGRDAARAILQRCLSLDPQQRPASMVEVAAAWLEPGLASLSRDEPPPQANSAKLPAAVPEPAPGPAGANRIESASAPLTLEALVEPPTAPPTGTLPLPAGPPALPIQVTGSDISPAEPDPEFLPEDAALPEAIALLPPGSAPEIQDPPVPAPALEEFGAWKNPKPTDWSVFNKDQEEDPELDFDAPAAAVKPTILELSGTLEESGTSLPPIIFVEEASGPSADLAPWQPPALAVSGPVLELFESAESLTSQNGAPERKPLPSVPSVSTGAGRRLALAASIAVGLGGVFSALQHRTEADTLKTELARTTRDHTTARVRLDAAQVRIKALEQERTALQLAGLTKSRDEWATVVSGLLTARPADATLQEAWKAAVGPLAERLKLALAAADAETSLAADSMTPRWNLASMYSALGRENDALPLLERIAQDLATMTAGGTPLDETHALLAARNAARRGAILLEKRKTMEAVPLIQAASQAFEAWLPAHPDQHPVAREYAENSLLEGRALLERHQPREARTALARIATLLGQAGDPGFLPVDYFTLSDSHFSLAALDGDEGKMDSATEHYMDAIRVLLAYDQTNPQSEPCRRRLAEGYFRLGKFLSKNGPPGRASVAFNEAAKLLTQLTTESPADSSYKLQLALTYNEVAQLVRLARPNAAGATEALEYQNFSVTCLRGLNETNTLDNTYRRYLATTLVLNGELQEAAGESKTALSRHTEALDTLDELLAENALSDDDRRDCRRLSARAWTSMGGMQEKAGNKDAAIASLSKALEAWTGFAGEDPAAAQNVASTREKLRKLKPSG